MKELKDLQVGDEVAILRLSSKVLGKVEEIADTQVVVESVPYSKETGWNIDEKGRKISLISIPNEEEIEELRIATMKRFIGNFFFSHKMYTLSVEQIKQVYNIIKSKDNERV